MEFIPKIYHSEAELWLKILKATLPVALEAHSKYGAIIPFGGYLSKQKEIVFIGHPEVLPPTTGINSWIFKELKINKEAAIVTIRYSEVRYQNKAVLQINLESPHQNPTEIMYQITPPEMLLMTVSQRRIW